MDLSTMTPVEIDTALYELYNREFDAERALRQARDGIHRAAGDKLRTRRSTRRSTRWTLTFEEALEKVYEIAEDVTTLAGSDARRALTRLEAAEKALADIRNQQEIYDAEYVRRGGWTRAFLAQSHDGHVHNTMHCSTCNRGGTPTRFTWMVEYSGKTETEIVEAAGSRACTVCYPSAPLDILARPTTMFGPDEIAKQKAKEERERKAAEKKAKAAANAITNPDGTPLRSEGGRGSIIKTLRTAWIEITDEAWYAQAWGDADGRHEREMQHLAKAIAHKEGKTVEQVIEEARKKAARRK